ncbi:PREDICTED: MND1-interacting protein 1 isoform X2 [Camelina sativa]|uniref:MND1-interacting protein 1 isoform X1 n=1 Tax=Camelina sativa TaxID=90675 RepID=A0ABM1QYJ1_CAMSA|nr:PREDICTED: MND1-interacting protein 1 isoform X1 [Camelina sativa]XP_010461076.1 PREDICTED: MND1-interacting protein 1 isoform X1 [Camelina sativa]XP_019091829.1 PREDICTED: MND1-interacting protein 1 isoform X2 [Camelina sativa]
MGCTVREKHVKPSRRIRPVAFRSDPPLCLIERIALSKSIVESSLKNLVYHPGLTDSGSVVNSSSPSEWGYCTEEHLEEILLKHLEFFYNQAVSKLLDLGYQEGVAVKAVLSNGHCYGELDVLTNIMNNSLSYLNTTSCDGGEVETDFTDLRDLEEYSLAGMIYLLQQVKPNLSKGDAMWCLLMSELHVGRATTMDIPTPSPGNRASCCCTSTKDDDSNKEDVGSTSLDIAGFMAPALCRFHGGWDFGNGGGPEFSGNGFSTSGTAELKLQREIDCPKRFNLSPSMKSLMKRNVAAFAAGFRASMKQKQIQSETCGDSISPARVETCEQQQPRKSGSEESVGSVLEKFRDLNLDDDSLESVGEDGKDCVIVNLLHQVKDLEKKLKERKEWAHKKAMQAAQKVSEELADFKSLNSEREAIQLLKKGKKAVEESTMKRLSDKQSGLKKVTGERDTANLIVRKLENQNAEIRAEREGSKLSASESLKAFMEETKKEKKCLKKLVAWEKQKLKLQDEITAEKDKINALYRNLAQTTQDEKEIEAKWRQEQKAKETAVAQMEEEQRSKEAAEGHNKRKLETLRLKIELDFQRHKDDHQRLEQELSRLRASSDTDSSHLSNNVWKPEKSQGENIAKLLEELDKLEGTNENEANYDRECIICMKDEVSVVFLPCAHQVVCGSCSDSFFANNNNGGRKVTCPCCRSLIQQRIRIFGATS